MTAEVCASTGPLLSATPLDESVLLDGGGEAAVESLAYVGLGGRYARVAGHHFWRRWDGQRWRQCSIEQVHTAIRRVLGAVYDRRMEADPTPTETVLLLRLMGLNWRLGPLMDALGREVTVPPERLS